MSAVQKVAYKPESMSTDEFIVLVHVEEYQQWSKGDHTIPLADVVDGFQVFHSSTGAQGKLGRPSKQQLDTVFGTHTDTDVVTAILEKGQLVGTAAMGHTRQANNEAQHKKQHGGHASHGR